MRRILLPIGIILLILGALFSVSGASNWTPSTPPGPTPTVTPTEPVPEPFVDITIKTLDEDSKPVSGAIYVDGQKIGTGTATFEAMIDQRYRASYGSVSGYTTPHEDLFIVEKRTRQLSEGGTTIVGIYYEVGGEPSPDKIQLKVYVFWVYQTYRIYSPPVAGATVKIAYNNLRATTDDLGKCVFYVPRNYGSLRIDVYHADYGSLSRTVTIGSSDQIQSFYYRVPRFSVFLFSLFDLQGVTAPMELLIGIALVVAGISSTYVGAKAFTEVKK